MKKFFGTDGIRGKAGEYPLDRETVTRLGQALGKRLRERDDQPRLLIGRDTRESGDWIEECLARGARSMGVEIHLGGVLPTPAVASLVKKLDYHGGMVISASHNAFEDNGIKVFSSSGFKLPDVEEAELERLMGRDDYPESPPGAMVSNGPGVDYFREFYLDFLRSALMEDVTFNGMRIVLDCSNGAASELAARLYRSLGAAVISLHDQPDGRNINLDCGSLHPRHLMDAVPANAADLGIAFDGDADRALFVDGRGQLVDGDHVLFLCGRHLKERGLLRESHIVTTVMANIGLELALSEERITMDRTQVGDKYVLERMVEKNCVLGGEQSGHIIFLHRATTGDGMLTGLKVLEVMAHTGRTLEELARPVVKYPQVLLNLPVASKPELESLPLVMEKIRQVESELEKKGRVVVRYSGTENLARVMVEGPSQDQIERQAREIAEVLASGITAVT